MNVKGILLTLGFAGLTISAVAACSSKTTIVDNGDASTGKGKDSGKGGDDDDDDTSTATGAVASCVKTCEAANKAACGDKTADCETSCEDSTKNLPKACESDYEALQDCFLGGKFSCDDKNETVTDADCTTELEAAQACVKKEGGGSGGTCGNIALGDSTCVGCTDQNCCDEGKACSDSADCLAVIDCINDCAANDDACVKACIGKPGADLLSALVKCATDKCGTECK